MLLHASLEETLGEVPIDLSLLPMSSSFATQHPRYISSILPKSFPLVQELSLSRPNMCHLRFFFAGASLICTIV